MRLRHLLSSLLVLAFCRAGETGKLTGKIIDQSTQKPLIGVNVTIKGSMLGAATDARGEFIILNIPAAKYTVSAAYIGYMTVIVNDVIIHADRTTRLDLAMEVSAVKGEEVVVKAKRALIERDQTATTMTILEEDFANMPVNSYTEVLNNLAGVIDNENGGGDDGIHIRGGRSGEIAYLVDGFFVEDAIFGGMGSDVARGGISELSVITGSFNAEYGEAMSGVINIVTREGSSDYTWNIRGATDQLGPETSNWNTNRMEGTVSGPILPFYRNLGTFFLSGDKLATDTYLKKSYLPKDVLKVDVNGDGNYDGEDGDQYALSDLDFDGDLDELKKGAMNTSSTFRNDQRLTGKLVLRPLGKLKVTLGSNLLRRVQRTYNLSYRQLPDNNAKNWLDSDLWYATLNYTFNNKMFATVKYSEFRNENWTGNPKYLNSRHELFAEQVDIDPSWNPGFTAMAPGTEWVWFSHYAEPFEDLNLDGHWNAEAAEWWDDADGNGIWDEGEDFLDVNGDSVWTFFGAERYMDIDHNGRYNFGVTVPLREGDAYDNTSNYEFYGSYPVVNNYGDTVRTTASDYYSYEHYRSLTKSIQGSLTWQITKQHQLKTGFEKKNFMLNNFRASGLGGGPFGITSDPAFVIWEKQPEQRSFYLQDKIEYDDIIINVGLRWDYMDPNSDYANPSKQLRFMYEGVIYTNAQLPDSVRPRAEWGYIDIHDGEITFVKAPQANIKSHWSPRLGIGYPITERMAFHFSYGQFIQYPEYENMYRLSNSNGYAGLPGEMSNLQQYIAGQTGASSTQIANSLFGNSLYPFPYSLGDWYIPPVGSPNLRPETTIAYEFGLRTQLAQDYVLNTTAFYKDIYDYIAAVIYDADPTEYSVFENMDYGNAKGFEVSVRKLFNNKFAWSINYTYTRAEGNASNEYQHWDDAYTASVYGTYPARKTIIMPWDQPHTLNIAFDYRHPRGLGLNLIGNIGSGLPYTPSDARGRPLDESNSGRMPPTAVFDLKAYYDLKLAVTDLRLYADITNLFNKENILNVFNDSGKPGESLNPNTSPMWEHRPYYYGQPRHIELGISLGMK